MAESNGAACVQVAAFGTNAVKVALDEAQQQGVVPERPQTGMVAASQVDTYEEEQELRRQKGREVARLARYGKKPAENGEGGETGGTECPQAATVEQRIEEKKKVEEARILEAMRLNDARFRSVPK